MDFRGRSHPERAAAAATPANSTGAQSPFSTTPLSKVSQRPVGKAIKLGSVLLLFAVTGLVVALTFLLALGGDSQLQSVNKDRYQAVFLNNGQVYFGNIKDIDNDTLDLRNIYYLQTSNAGDTSTQASTNANVSLVKLGCELHAPLDQMIINNDQVIFWENLQDSSQVVKAIAEYKTPERFGRLYNNQPEFDRAGAFHSNSYAYDHTDQETVTSPAT